MEQRKSTGCVCISRGTIVQLLILIFLVCFCIAQGYTLLELPLPSNSHKLEGKGWSISSKTVMKFHLYPHRDN